MSDQDYTRVPIVPSEDEEQEKQSSKEEISRAPLASAPAGGEQPEKESKAEYTRVPIDRTPTGSQTFSEVEDQPKTPWEAVKNIVSHPGEALKTASEFYEAKPEESRTSRIAKGLGRVAMIAPSMVQAVVTPAQTPEEEAIVSGAEAGLPGTATATLAAKRLFVDPSVAASEHVHEMARAQEAELKKQGKTDENLDLSFFGIQPGSLNIPRTKAYEAMGSALAKVPIIGPWALGEGERAGKGDIAGALTETGALVALPELLKEAGPGGALPGAPRAGEPAFPVTQAAGRSAVEAAKPPVQAAIRGAAGLAERAVEKSPVGRLTGIQAPDFVTRLKNLGRTEPEIALDSIKRQLDEAHGSLDQANARMKPYLDGKVEVPDRVQQSVRSAQEHYAQVKAAHDELTRDLSVKPVEITPEEATKSAGLVGAKPPVPKETAPIVPEATVPKTAPAIPTIPGTEREVTTPKGATSPFKNIQEFTRAKNEVLESLYPEVEKAVERAEVPAEAPAVEEKPATVTSEPAPPSVFPTDKAREEYSQDFEAARKAAATKDERVSTDFTIDHSIAKLTDADLKKFARVQDINPDDYDLSIRDKNRHRTERNMLVKKIVDSLGDGDVETAGRLIEQLEKRGYIDDAARSSKLQAQVARDIWSDKLRPKAESTNTRLSEDELLNKGYTHNELDRGLHLPGVSGGAPDVAGEAERYIRELEKQGVGEGEVLSTRPQESLRNLPAGHGEYVEPETGRTATHEQPLVSEARSADVSTAARRTMQQQYPGEEPIVQLITKQSQAPVSESRALGSAFTKDLLRQGMRSAVIPEETPRIGGVSVPEADVAAAAEPLIRHLSKETSKAIPTVNEQVEQLAGIRNRLGLKHAYAPTAEEAVPGRTVSAEDIAKLQKRTEAAVTLQYTQTPMESGNILHSVTGYKGVGIEAYEEPGEVGPNNARVVRIENTKGAGAGTGKLGYSKLFENLRNEAAAGDRPITVLGGNVQSPDAMRVWNELGKEGYDVKWSENPQMPGQQQPSVTFISGRAPIREPEEIVSTPRKPSVLGRVGEDVPEYNKLTNKVSRISGVTPDVLRFMHDELGMTDEDVRAEVLKTREPITIESLQRKYNVGGASQEYDLAKAQGKPGPYLEEAPFYQRVPIEKALKGRSTVQLSPTNVLPRELVTSPSSSAESRAYPPAAAFTERLISLPEEAYATGPMPEGLKRPTFGESTYNPELAEEFFAKHPGEIGAKETGERLGVHTKPSSTGVKPITEELFMTPQAQKLFLLRDAFEQAFKEGHFLPKEEGIPKVEGIESSENTGLSNEAVARKRLVDQAKATEKENLQRILLEKAQANLEKLDQARVDAGTDKARYDVANDAYWEAKKLITQIKSGRGISGVAESMGVSQFAGDPLVADISSVTGIPEKEVAKMTMQQRRAALTKAASEFAESKGIGIPVERETSVKPGSSVEAKKLTRRQAKALPKLTPEFLESIGIQPWFSAEEE